MRQIVRLSLFFFLIQWIHSTAFAQEVRVPLFRNTNLGSTQTQGSSVLHKSGATVPFLDYFVKPGKPSSSRWIQAHATVENRQLVLNAIDSTGNAYAAPGLMDELESLPMDIGGGKAFVSFHVSAGSSWQAGDSLVFYGKNRFDNWEVLQIINVAWADHEVLLDIDPAVFSTSKFALKWSLYSDRNLNSNNQTYTLANVVVAYRIGIPFAEQFRDFNMPDSTASRWRVAAPDVRLMPGAEVNFSSGNCARLDAMRSDSSVYSGGDNSYGGADTLVFHPIDMLSLQVSDSAYWSLVLRPSAQNAANDTLVVEFRNNLNEWVRMLVLKGNTNSGSFVNYIFPVNYGRFRHSFFQVRVVMLTQRSAGSQSYWLTSGAQLYTRTTLPFFDDFSTSRIRVSTDRWIDNFVFVNNDFPVNHPSLNVATFDGLDANGNAYSRFALKGTCDMLTSRPISLRGLNASDSVLLSFYYQYEPQGTTDQIYPDDSLIVELRGSAIDADSFVVVGRMNADDSLLYRFLYFEYMVTDPVFFNEAFQIRIRNRGSLTGNLSQWHVDYVRLNKGRRRGDAYKDIALSNTPALNLGPYTSMPWYQYTAAPAGFLNSPDRLRLVNHDDQPYAVDYFRSVIRPEGDTLDKFNNILPTINARSDSSVNVNKSLVFNTTVTADSLVFQTRYRIKISGNQNDNVTGNDTISVPTIFSNYLAYDDGTAEGGYGVKNKINVGACLKYTLPVPDSLVGVYVFFNQSEKDVSTQRFNLKVWKKLSPLFEPATSDQVMYNQEVQKPIYTGIINGFASFRFTEPLPVQDSFFIGWDQTSAYVLNVGLDKNYRQGLNPNMFYKMDGRWYPTEIPGALMIRPILKKFFGTPSGILPVNHQKEEMPFVVYPNPTNGNVHVSPEPGRFWHTSVTDLAGRSLGVAPIQNGNIDLSFLPGGFYLLVFENPESGQKFVSRILKTETE